MRQTTFKVGDLVRVKVNSPVSKYQGIYIVRSAAFAPTGSYYRIGNLDGSHIYADWPTIFVFERELEAVS